MIWLNFKILNINWDRCILSLVTWFKLGDRHFPLLLPALASSPGACPSSLLMWPVSVSFLLWTAIVSSCYPLVASLFLFLILGWICKWGLTFPLIFLSLEVQTDLTPTTTSTLFFRAICAANQCGPSVYALGLDKSTAFDSNLEYFLMEIHIWTNCSYLRPWNMYVKFHI